MNKNIKYVYFENNKMYYNQNEENTRFKIDIYTYNNFRNQAMESSNNLNSFKVVLCDDNGNLYLKEIKRSNEDIKKILRGKRKYCFSIINRGQAWYNSLNDQQKQELQEWYQAWLNVTDTLIEPEKPTWLN